MTTQEMGWDSKKNGDLIALAEKEFDVLITSDQNMSYQQNLSKRNIAILLLPTNRWPVLSTRIEAINTALEGIAIKEFRAITFDL